MTSPVQILGVVAGGNSTAFPAQSLVSPRMGAQGDQIVSGLHGRLYEANYRGKLFYGSNGAVPSVTTVALATTYTGLCLYNPASSGVNIIVEQVGYGFNVAFVAAATIGLLVGYAAAGIVTASAAASPGASSKIGSANTPAGRCALSATLVGTPYLHTVFGEGLTGAITTVPQGAPRLVNIDGSIILPPGAYTAIYTSTASGAAALCASFHWQEELV